MDRISVLHGDCLAILPTLDAESIDAIVTDPPYDLTSGKRGGTGVASISDTPAGRSRISTGNGSGGFMGKSWDATGVAFDPATWREALRVAKPGAHLLAFGGTRTFHRLACAIEDAGWEIRDTLVWAYAQGFPKSLDVSKAIDKAAGAKREVVGKSGRHIADGAAAASNLYAQDDWTRANGRMGEFLTAPATPEAAKWQGWGTALKPAWEPIVLARKPLRGTVAANVQQYGTGALNIDGCRIPFTGPADEEFTESRNNWRDREFPGPAAIHVGERAPKGEGINSLGRWPANLLLTDPIFDGDTPGVVGGGAQIDGGSHSRPGGQDTGIYGAFGPSDTPGYGDSGTYSRFFLIPKADRSDREPKTNRLPKQSRQGKYGTVQDARPHTPDGYQYARPPRQNTHPTVKPTELMRHLVRLVTPPGGLVLDPFLGSGTTALACDIEGFRCIGIEREAEYVEMANARLLDVDRGLGLVG